MHTLTRTLILALATFSLLACSDATHQLGSIDGSADLGADLHTAKDSGSDALAADQGAGPRLYIVIRGDSTPKTINDGFSGQTPSKYVMGLSRYEVMTSANDPNPVLVFDHGNSPVEIDMLSAQPQIAGSARIADLPAGSYTHGRVRLTKSVFTVATTVHATVALPGTVEVKAALSDTTIDGTPWKQGQVSYTFSVWPTPVPGMLPPLPATPGGTIVQKDGETWMVFPFLQPLPVSPNATQSYEAVITYGVYESFRWQDDSTNAAYQPKVYDVSVLPAPSFETVVSFGATGYDITWGAKP